MAEATAQLYGLRIRCNIKKNLVLVYCDAPKCVHLMECFDTNNKENVTGAFRRASAEKTPHFELFCSCKLIRR